MGPLGETGMSSSPTDDLVTQQLRASAHRLGAVAIFSGVINLLMLSGSLYMLQVYDRVLPSRNLATLFGLLSDGTGGVHFPSLL